MLLAYEGSISTNKTFVSNLFCVGAVGAVRIRPMSLRIWLTPSGITEQQARDACQRTLESYAAYNICREYVDLEQLIAMCALNVQVRDCFVYCGLYKVAQIKQHYEYCSDFLAKHTNSVKQTKFIQKQYSTCHGVNSSPFPHLVWKSFQDTTQTPNFSSTIKRPITKTYLVR